MTIDIIVYRMPAVLKLYAYWCNVVVNLFFKVYTGVCSRNRPIVYVYSMRTLKTRTSVVRSARLS